MDDAEIVRAFYQQDDDYEWRRFEQHPIEFELTKRFLRRYVQTGQRVLDVGGGPGRYALFCAAQGCDVTLVDLAENHVRVAKQRAEEAGLPLRALAGDARGVDRLVDGPFDHILLMGPLYHLTSEADRVRCVQACLRLLKPGGLLYVSFIASYSGLVYSMKNEPAMILNPQLREHFEQFAQDDAFSGTAFTQAYFARIDEVLPFMARFPLEKLHFFSQEGMLAPNENELLAQPPEVLDAWIDLAERVCERPDLLSYAEHLMYIGKKAQAPQSE